MSQTLGIAKVKDNCYVQDSLVMFAFARPMQPREYCDECMRSRVDWQTTRSSLDTDTSSAVEETSLIGQKRRQKSTDRKTSNYYSWLGHRHDDHGIYGRHCCFLTAGGSEQIGGHTCHLRSSLLLPFTGSASGMRQRHGGQCSAELWLNSLHCCSVLSPVTNKNARSPH